MFRCKAQDEARPAADTALPFDVSRLPDRSRLWAWQLDKGDSVGAGLRGKLSQHLECIDVDLEHFAGPARRDPGGPARTGGCRS